MNGEEYALDHAIGLVIFAILTLAGLVMEVIGFIDSFLASVMTALHVPPNAQIILLVVAAVFLAIAALRALGGVFGALLIVLLVLLLLHMALPGMQVPAAHLPDAAPGQGQTAI
jgi:hypothetical protein